jgi:hypothetical protein
MSYTEIKSWFKLVFEYLCEAAVATIAEGYVLHLKPRTPYPQLHEGVQPPRTPSFLATDHQ